MTDICLTDAAKLLIYPYSIVAFLSWLEMGF